MYKIPKQSYTLEFKQEAVRQVKIEGKSQAQVSREPGGSVGDEDERIRAYVHVKTIW